MTQRQEAIDLAKVQRISGGDSVFDEASEATQFFLLLDGHIRVERLNEDGDRVISMHIPPGQMFGIARALGRETYPASAIAASECLLLAWPSALWNVFCERYPGFSEEAQKVVGQRFAEMNNRIMELATQHVEQRVASAILRLMEQHGQKVDEGIQIAFPVTRRAISEMTGTTLHTVSRLLSRWEKQNILCSRRRHIHVLDAGRLRKLCH